MDRIPEVAAALVCQVQIKDATTGTPTLVNVFSILHMPVPGQATFALYVKMIDGEGRHNGRIRFVRLRDEKEIFALPGLRFDWADPLQPLEIGINFPPVPIEEEGLHELQIFMNEIYVGRTAFQIKSIPASEGKGESS